MENSKTRKQLKKELEQYMRTMIKPIIKELYIRFIRAHPEDPIRFMIDYLE